jgi:hypothetical protein
MTHLGYKIISSIVRMELETIYTAAVLAYFVFGQSNICYSAKLTLAAITCTWSLIV